LSLMALAVSGGGLLLLVAMNRGGVMERTPYLLVGIVMWVALLKSGVHATLAGVLLAMCIPIRDSEKTISPLHDLEHDLHTAVAFGILPLFAFANAGISLLGVGVADLLHGVPLGVAAGLFVGKQVGVFLACGLCVVTGLVRMPTGMSWAHLYGVSLLCGIGFTMSLFIASLAFEHRGGYLLFDERLGILVGSLLSAVAGYLVLRFSLPSEAESGQAADREET